MGNVTAPQAAQPTLSSGIGPAEAPPVEGVELLPLEAQEVRDIARGHGPDYESWRRYWRGLEPGEREPLTHPAWVAGHLHGQLRTASGEGWALLFHGAGQVLSVLPIRYRGPRGVFEHVRGLDCRSWAIARADHRVALEALFRCRPDDQPLHCVELEGVEDDHHLLDPDWPHLAADTWYRSLIDMRDGYEAMLSRLSSNARHGVKRLSRKIGKKHEVDVQAITELERIEDGFRRFLDVDARSWKAESGSLLRDDERQRESLRASLHHMARHERAVIHVLRADGVDIAVQLGCVIDGQLQIIKTSYDVDWSQFGPGKLLLAETMRTWCEGNGVTAVNMVTGLDWHQMWLPRNIVTHRLWLFAPGLRGRLAQLRAVPPRLQAKATLRRWHLEEPVRRLLRKPAD